MSSTQPSPALVTQRAAARLPRWALWSLIAAYVLPGVLGRDPWRNADLTAYGYMWSLAHGQSPWLAPTLGGAHPDAALLPHWLGAAAIWLTTPWLDAALAVRLPFALLLGACLGGVWYATYHLARTEPALPVAFAFGGEASEVDYARALADGALLALMASLGLLELGHETTPELMQLALVTGLIWALAVVPKRPSLARTAVLLLLPMLAASGAPALALMLALTAAVVCALSSHATARALVPWLALAALAAVLVALGLGAWHWRLVAPDDARTLLQMARAGIWFTWPVWPLALWTLWRWRRQLRKRHISVPLATLAVLVPAWLAMGGSDRVMLLMLPGLAVLAAFALPTFARGTGAAMDWFSVFFFTAAAIAVWVVAASIYLGVPAQPLANIMRLAPGFKAPQTISLWVLVPALAATIAWLALVRWRTARHRHALWKMLALPAGGVALTWLLVMTLLMPPLNYARSLAPWVNRVAPHVPAGACVQTGLPPPFVAALVTADRWQVHTKLVAPTDCGFSVSRWRMDRAQPVRPGWQLVALVRQPTDRQYITGVWRREGGSAAAPK
ncbi:MAG: hypothetical protein LCH73_01970 [Proteobacteria bacterium]|nr:hypothetical protein [Pseudomonadota bacterium]